MASHCPEFAKPGTQTPVLTEMAESQRPGAGGRWDDPEDTHGPTEVSSLKKQQAGMSNKLASTEPKASRSTSETETRSEAPETQLAASLSRCRLGLEVPLLGGHSQRGAPHQGICLPLKQTLSCGAKPQSSIGTPRCTGSTPCQEVRSLSRCASWL